MVTYWRARLRFWWMCWRFDTWRAVRRAGSECVATWGDYRECGDLRGHVEALAGVLLGRVTEDSAEWRAVRHD
jgi:hypothetical protein